MFQLDFPTKFTICPFDVPGGEHQGPPFHPGDPRTISRQIEVVHGKLGREGMSESSHGNILVLKFSKSFTLKLPKQD